MAAEWYMMILWSEHECLLFEEDYLSFSSQPWYTQSVIFLLRPKNPYKEERDMMKTFDIVGCEKITDISQKQEYKKLMLTDEQKIQISGLLQ